MKGRKFACRQRWHRPQRPFHLRLVLCWPDGHEEGFEGRIDGSVLRGDRGFGYDPIFVAGATTHLRRDGPQEKLDIGHRADAFAKLVAACFPW